MTSDWTRKPLGKVAYLQRGFDLPSQDRVEGSIPIIGSSGLTGWHNEAKTNGPGVVVGRSGASYGVVSYVESDHWPLNTALFVKKFCGNDIRFVYYLLKDFRFEGYNSGSAQPSLNRNFVHPVQVLVPPLDEQRRIAHVLGTLDDKIELNRQMNATLEAIAQAIFKSWFVDFDRHDDLVESDELGLIPRGWEVKTLHQMVKITGGGTPKRSVDEYWDGGTIPWFSVKDAPGQNVFVINTSEHITPKGLSESSTRCVPKGTTIISARGTVGELAITACDMAYNQSCYGVNGIAPMGDYTTYYFLRKSVERLRQNAHGSVFDTITRKTFKTIKHAVPPKDDALWVRFEEQVKPLMTKIEINLEQSRTLTELRDTLLPKLISGELRVPEALEIADEAVEESESEEKAKQLTLGL